MRSHGKREHKEEARGERTRAGKWRRRYWTLLIAVAATVVLCVCLVKHSFFAGTDGTEVAEAVEAVVVGEEGEVATVTEVSLNKLVRDSRLYTVEYPYNGYARVYDEDGVTLKYYVAYEGTVRAGIDVSQIEVSCDEGRGAIVVRLPEASVETVTVDAGSMEYIFMDEKYDTETVAQEAYREAVADLTRRSREDSNIISTAMETAKAVEKAYLEPWVNQNGEGKTYTVRVLAYGEEE